MQTWTRGDEADPSICVVSTHMPKTTVRHCSGEAPTCTDHRLCVHLTSVQVNNVGMRMALQQFARHVMAVADLVFAYSGPSRGVRREPASCVREVLCAWLRRESRIAGPLLFCHELPAFVGRSCPLCSRYGYAWNIASGPGDTVLLGSVVKVFPSTASFMPVRCRRIVSM